MKPSGYILLINSADRVPLSPHHLQEIKHVLGPQTTPLMAWGTGAAIGFSESESAKAVMERIKMILGDKYQILILQLGMDHSQWGSRAHQEFLAHLRWLLGGESQ
jgi:hypothetical protein